MILSKKTAEPHVCLWKKGVEKKTLHYTTKRERNVYGWKEISLYIYTGVLLSLKCSV